MVASGPGPSTNGAVVVLVPAKMYFPEAWVLPREIRSVRSASTSLASAAAEVLLAASPLWASDSTRLISELMDVRTVEVVCICPVAVFAWLMYWVFRSTDDW